MRIGIGILKLTVLVSEVFDSRSLNLVSLMQKKAFQTFATFATWSTVKESLLLSVLKNNKFNLLL